MSAAVVRRGPLLVEAWANGRRVATAVRDLYGWSVLLGGYRADQRTRYPDRSDVAMVLGGYAARVELTEPATWRRAEWFTDDPPGALRTASGEDGAPPLTSGVERAPCGGGAQPGVVGPAVGTT